MDASGQPDGSRFSLQVLDRSLEAAQNRLSFSSYLTFTANPTLTNACIYRRQGSGKSSSNRQWVLSTSARTFESYAAYMLVIHHVPTFHAEKKAQRALRSFFSTVEALAEDPSDDDMDDQTDSVRSHV